MRLYHPRIKFILTLVILLLVIGCSGENDKINNVRAIVIIDNQEKEVFLPENSTVNEALNELNIIPTPLDKITPPLNEKIIEGITIQVIRVTEKFEKKQEIIPYNQQTVRNESLSKDYELIIQTGENGLKETTFKNVYENGIKISEEPILINSTIIKQPIPEIRMIGIQSPHTATNIPGRIFYIDNGNIWVMDKTTGNRKALLTTADLDSRVFTISNDGTTLLFTRTAESKTEINRLWALILSIDENNITDESKTIDLKIANIIHFADFVPGTNTKIVFSTVEPREYAPGWQANNDLNVITFSNSGWITDWDNIIDSNSGGVYGWWGRNYLWKPNSQRLAFAQPDGIGIIDYLDGTENKIINIPPYQVTGDWAWVPGITWGSENTLYFINHNYYPDTPKKESSPLFDLAAFQLTQKHILTIVSETGMFANPISITQPSDDGNITDNIAYLQAISATESDSSNYRVALLNSDELKNRIVFPDTELPGLQPSGDWGVWSPKPLPNNGHYTIAVCYHGNIWFIDSVTGEATQITSSGQITRIIWQ